MTSSTPIVAVSAAIRSDGDVASARLRHSYLAALANARLVPVVTTPEPHSAAAEQLMNRLDGLVLTGGSDIGPALYGETAHPRLGPVSDARDTWEAALIRAAQLAEKPVLAICRGAQILNVALGGTLIQDLPSEHPSDINHDPDLPRTHRSHAVQVANESRLSRALGATDLSVNSVHHQAIARAASQLRVVSTAPDGVIEGVETSADSGWWCVGVQWHPEELVNTDESWDRNLFAAFSSVLHDRAKNRG